MALSPEDYPAQALPPYLPPGTEKTYVALLAIDSRFFETAIEEAASVKETAALVRAAQIGSLGDIPLVVLTRGLSTGPDLLSVSEEEAQQGEAVWDELQAELAALSSNGKQVVAEQSGHYIQSDQPELVIDAIRQVVEAAGR
jgi:hypothetical protein